MAEWVQVRADRLQENDTIECVFDEKPIEIVGVEVDRGHVVFFERQNWEEKTTPFRYSVGKAAIVKRLPRPEELNNPVPEDW